MAEDLRLDTLPDRPRNYRMEAALDARESDRRDPREVLSWTRDRDAHPHCSHTPEQHEALGWTCPIWPAGGPCCRRDR